MYYCTIQIIQLHFVHFYNQKIPSFQAFLPVGGMVYILGIIPILPKGHICSIHKSTQKIRNPITKKIPNLPQNSKITSTIVSVDALFLRFLPIFLYPKFTQTTQKNHPQSKKIKPFIELSPNHQFFIKLNTIKPPKISSSKLLKPLINQPFQQN